MTDQIVVFDIDGVLADDTHRIKYIRGHADHAGKDWEAYYQGAAHDKPLNHGYWLHFSWHTKPEVEIYFSTGRPEKYRDLTRTWLTDNLSSPPEAGHLLMRPDKNRTSNTELKLGHLDQMGGPDAITAWHDDNPSVIEAMLGLGVPAIYIPSKGWDAKEPPRRAVTTAAYERFIASTRTYPSHEIPGALGALNYVCLGLGEAGEIQGKAKKIWRDDNGILTDERRDAMLGEAGDLLWYLAELARHLGTNLAGLAANNIDKLSGRLERGTIGGDGDVR